jgi:hypothetical protein
VIYYHETILLFLVCFCMHSLKFAKKLARVCTACAWEDL